MSDLKITIDQLKNYLWTGLKGYYKWFGNDFYTDFNELNIKTFVEGYESKLMFYRLSDLDKFIPELGFIPYEEVDLHHNFSTLRKDDLMIDPLRYPFTVIQALFQWHFWVFDQECFERGLVIDKLKHNA